MAKILIVAEHDGQALNSSTAKTVAAAATLNDPNIDVLVLAEAGAPVAEQAAKLQSVDRVLVVEDATNAHAIAAGQALLGVNQISDVMSVEDDFVFKRPIYAGNAVVTVEAPGDKPVVATIRPASYREVEDGNAAPVEILSIDVAAPTHTRFIEMQTAESDRPDLQTASRVVAGGRALGSQEGFELIYGLADKLGAGVGASRAAVDAGYVPNDLQVGQTGKIIAPELYFAVGISGAIQHLTGIKDAGTIVAINKDEEAPIFEFADIGLVADLFNVLPELTDALE